MIRVKNQSAADRKVSQGTQLNWAALTGKQGGFHLLPGDQLARTAESVRRDRSTAFAAVARTR